MKQLHPMRLTQGFIAHHYFWEGGQARFPALPFSPHSTYSRCGSYQALLVASQGVRRWPAAIAILEPHKNHEWRSGLAVNGLYHQDKTAVQRAALCSAKCTDTAGRPDDPQYDGEFQSLHGRPSPNSEQTTTTVSAGRHIQRVVTLSLRSVNQNWPIIC